MATTSIRKWYLVVRREGYDTLRIPLRINYVSSQPELDPLVDPAPVEEDFELIDDPAASIIVGEDLIASYEIVVVTQDFEIGSIT